MEALRRAIRLPSGAQLRFLTCIRATVLAATLVAAAIGTAPGTALAEPGGWRAEWPRTDFSQHAVPLEEIKSGGPRKDGIPSIDRPRFERLNDGVAAGWASRIGDAEPVISLTIRGDARAYPLSILIWHEIVNDSVGGTPVTLPHFPPCHASPGFGRTVGDKGPHFRT